MVVCVWRFPSAPSPLSCFVMKDVTLEELLARDDILTELINDQADIVNL